MEVVNQTDDDPFKRLPDGLIVSHIFDKVSEAKSLCRCSLVSKKFSSLVYQTITVSIKIPLEIPRIQPDRTPRLAAFPGKLVHAVTYPVAFVQDLDYDFIMDRSSQPPYCAFDFDLLLKYLPKFIGKFTLLKSLVVEFDYSEDFEDNNHMNFTKQPVVKWTFDSKSCCFILVMAPRSIDEKGKNIYVREVDLHKVVFDIHLGISVCTCIVIGYVVPSLPESVAQVVFTDSKKQSKMDVGETDLDEIRKITTNHVRPFFRTPEEEIMYLLKLYDESTLQELQQMEALASASASASASPSDVTVTSFFLGIAKAKCKGRGKGKGKGKNKGEYDDDYLEVKRAFQGTQAAYGNAEGD